MLDDFKSCKSSSSRSSASNERSQILKPQILESNHDPPRVPHNATHKSTQDDKPQQTTHKQTKRNARRRTTANNTQSNQTQHKSMQRTNQRKTKNHNDQYTYYSMELYPTGGILMCLVWGPRAGIIVVVVVQ